MARIAGYIIRSIDPRNTAEFYRAIGLTIQEEQHGKGTKHCSIGPVNFNPVFEIYSQTPSREQDIMVVLVPSISDVLERLKGVSNVVCIGPTKESTEGWYQIVQGPGNKQVMLIEESRVQTGARGSSQETMHHPV
jgi:hypothetical protein